MLTAKAELRADGAVKTKKKQTFSVFSPHSLTESGGVSNWKMSSRVVEIYN